MRHPSEDEKEVVVHSSPEFKTEIHATDTHLRVKSKYTRLDEFTDGWVHIQEKQSKTELEDNQTFGGHGGWTRRAWNRTAKEMKRKSNEHGTSEAKAVAKNTTDYICQMLLIGETKWRLRINHWIEQHESKYCLVKSFHRMVGEKTDYSRFKRE